jgi:hypothetical protein
MRLIPCLGVLESRVVPVAVTLFPPPDVVIIPPYVDVGSAAGTYDPGGGGPGPGGDIGAAALGGVLSDGTVEAVGPITVDLDLIGIGPGDPEFASPDDPAADALPPPDDYLPAVP